MNGIIFLNIVGGISLIFFSIQVLTTVNVYGKFPTKAVKEMMRVTLRSPKLLLFVAAILGLFDSLFQPFLSSWIPPFPRLLITGLSLIALNGACLPPTFLYLAASNAKAFSLMSDLQFAIAPLKIVHMLETFQAGAVPGDQINQSGYRVSGNWQQAVRSLAEITPLIIVDCRVVTESVIQETDYILKSGLHDRTFFVADDIGRVPTLSYLNLPQNTKLNILTSQQLINTLQRIGWKFLLSNKKNLVQHVNGKLKDYTEENSLRVEEINAAHRVNSFSDYSDTCVIRECCLCGCKVWVNKRAPSNIRVCCMECAKHLVRKSKKVPFWRFPFE